jgi:hypothetical protein
MVLTNSATNGARGRALEKSPLTDDDLLLNGLSSKGSALIRIGF